MLAESDATEPREDRQVLLATGLEGHWWCVEADPDVDRPELFHGSVVESREGAVREAREHEPARGRDRAAVVGIGNVYLCFALAGERIDGVEIGLIALGRRLHAATEARLLVAQRRIAGEIGAGRKRRHVHQFGPRTVGGWPEVVAAGGAWAHRLGELAW